MKAVQLVGYKKNYEIRDIPVPKLGENDVLVKVGAAGFYHTDYQPVGAVVSVGSAVQGKWEIGQRVGVLLFRHACKMCIGCKTTNDIRFCKNHDLAGLMADADNICLLPDSVPFEQAAPLMCAGATVFEGIAKTKALGYQVVAIDNRIEGRELATEFPLKADLIVDSEDGEAVSKVKSWTGKGGLDAIIVTTDHVPVTLWSLKLLHPNGFCVPLGLPTTGVPFDAFELIFQQHTIIGSVVATQANAQEMLNTVGKLGIRSHLTTVTFEKVLNLPDIYMNTHLKGRLEMKIE
ncbi:GroES-like protein [Lindgomyces ingoldianus]|uniref:GroES-like protein n=1 Tax=Lindgomyces ingoldianus TaxID=673940 RepID=A0ACB6QS52_9PLEO|nr:GroES-like protein [Lindgomyces ingoldianus]KAF2468907.1 GroES-like protein [Lindgomyces ingoldianus]